MAQGPFRLGEIVGRFGGGWSATRRSRSAAWRRCGARRPADLSFLVQAKYLPELAATRAAAVILPQAEREATPLPRIVCRDPYAYFARVSQLFNPPAAGVPGVHPTAVVAPDANVPASASVGAGCVVEPGVTLGERVVLGAGCVWANAPRSATTAACIRAWSSTAAASSARGRSSIPAR